MTGSRPTRLRSACAALVALATPPMAQEEGKQPAVALDQVPSPGASPDLNIQQPAPVSRAAAVTSGDVPVASGAGALATPPIAGSDMCDRTADDGRGELCRRRLEARAGEFRRPSAAPVTPEGRLLLLTGRASGTAQLETITGLNDPNGPAEQLAGALQSQAAMDPSANGSRPTQDATGPIPSGVPPVVILPRQ